MDRKLQVVCDWDDGAVEDLTLSGILRKHGAKATFNLCSSYLQGFVPQNRNGLQFMDKEQALAACQGFKVANHTTKHVSLPHVTMRDCKDAVIRGRAELQDIFQQDVKGFVYPKAMLDRTAVKVVQQAGHLYGRGLDSFCQTFTGGSRYTVRPHVNVRNGKFWKAYDEAKKGTRIFWFYGHSYEYKCTNDWLNLEFLIHKISKDPDAEWKNIEDLPWSV